MKSVESRNILPEHQVFGNHRVPGKTQISRKSSRPWKNANDWNLPKPRRTQIHRKLPRLPKTVKRLTIATSCPNTNCLGNCRGSGKIKIVKNCHVSAKMQIHRHSQISINLDGSYVNRSCVYSPCLTAPRSTPIRQVSAGNYKRR